MKNRLDLNFNINGSENRKNFLETYLSEINFTPTEAELSKMADYVLWGDKTATKAAGIELTTTQSSKKADILSLDDLQESPAFNESSILPITSPPTKIPKNNFSREEARREAPPHILEILENLWREIDATEVAAEDPSLSPYYRLKLKRLAIEKRRAQYSYRDFYRIKPSRFIPPTYSPPSEPNIFVYPMLRGNPKLDPIFFPDNHLPLPAELDPKTQKLISSLVWEKPSGTIIDLTNPNHVEAVLKAEIFSLQELPFDAIYSQILSTVDYFRNLTQLTKIESEVLRRKLAGQQNRPIAEEINSQFQKAYNPNYISTIYKKSIKKIAATAQLYRTHLENLFLPENFKKCNVCGDIFLISKENFMKKAISKDGYSSTCKRCMARSRRGGK